MLASGRSAWSPDPGSRFNAQAFQDKSQNKADTVRINPTLMDRVLTILLDEFEWGTFSERGRGWFRR